MQDSPNPFPFCSLCATWHPKDKHVHPMWANEYRKPWLSAERFNTWAVGFVCGMIFLAVIIAIRDMVSA